MDRYGELLACTRAVTEGGFSAAAFSLSLTPSAVSRLVSRLEDRLGVRLFSRSSRQVALTSPLTKSVVVLSATKCCAAKLLCDATCCVSHGAAAFYQRAVKTGVLTHLASTVCLL